VKRRTQELLFRLWLSRQPINAGNLNYALKNPESTAALMFAAFKAGRRSTMNRGGK
jgi:hypothetical protein